jgi:hypothetical protein
VAAAPCGHAPKSPAKVYNCSCTSCQTGEASYGSTPSELRLVM